MKTKVCRRGRKRKKSREMVALRGCSRVSLLTRHVGRVSFLTYTAQSAVTTIDQRSLLTPKGHTQLHHSLGVD